MFYEFKEKDEFYSEYLEYYIDRFVYTSVEIEDDQEKSVLKTKKRNLLEAFRYALNNGDDILNVWDIKNLEVLVNKGEDVPDNFRKIQVSAGTYATFTPVNPSEILPRLYSLLDSYKNIWCDLSVFEKEAMFHIEFMRIHPFEDGNKRIAKTILNRNLIFQDMAPIIIDEEDTELYYKFLNEKDYQGFAKFIETRSSLELTNMICLYKILNHMAIDTDTEDMLKYKRK